MRICFVCCEYPPGPHGGCGTFTQVLARALVAAGHQVHVVGVYRHSYPGPDYEEDQGVRVWRLRQPNHRFGWLQARVQLFRKISVWAKHDRIDLVDVPDWQGWAAGWPRLPIPVVVRMNGSASYFANELGSKVRRTTFWLERSALRRADHWCSVSQYTAERSREVFELSSGPDAVLYNSVEADFQSSPANRSMQDVVFTGTLTAKKGVYSLMKAWPQVFNENSEAHLHIYGKDGKTESGESVVATMTGMLPQPVRGSVTFHGHVERDELREALRTARLAVFPSYAEAFAIAPLEAMSTGCPTVYTQRGSGSELIDHGVNGLLVDPDNPQDIGDAICSLLHDDCLAMRIGQAGQTLVQEKFTDAAMLEQNILFYETCLGLDHHPVERQPVVFPRILDLSRDAPLVET